MTASFHNDGSIGPYNVFNMTASFHHDRRLGPCNLFSMTASFHHDGSLGPYNLFHMTTSFHHDGSLGSYTLFNITASFHHDGSLGPYNLFNMTASFHHDGSLEQYKLFNMTASFHHDGSLGPYNLFNMTASFHHDGNIGPYNLFKKIHEARAFNFTYRYIDDVLSINNSRFGEFLPLIYPPELEAKETTDTASSASFLDLYLEFDDSGQLSTNIYDKRDDFNFKIINFPNKCSNIPASPAYGVYISQLIRYARASSNYSDFLKRHLHLRNRLLDQGYKKIRLIRSLKKFIFRCQYLVEIYSVSAEKIISDAFSYSENV